MLPRLKAEASQRAATEIAVGSGTLKPHDRLALLREWADQADPAGPEGGPHRVKTRATPGNLAEMGIGYEQLPRRKRRHEADPQHPVG